VKIGPAVPEIFSRTDRQTDTQTDRQANRNTPLAYRGGVINNSIVMIIASIPWAVRLSWLENVY